MMKRNLRIAATAIAVALAFETLLALSADTATYAVIGKGAGRTEDQALKDALRDAVRQAVGEVVDAETLVKNDKIISDKVLTYSDGFIKEHTVVSSSKEGGLVRITIRATVERRQLIQKLQAANVTVKRMKGQDLFAKAITEEEAKANATQLLRKALADLPHMLTAEMVGKPTYAADKGEAVLRISIKPDRTAFEPFRERLEQLLQKISRRKETVTIQSVMAHGGSRRLLSSSEAGEKVDFVLPTWFHDKNKDSDHENRTLWPKLGNKGNWCVVLCTFNDGSHTTTRWTSYVLDADPVRTLSGLFGRTRPIVSLLDSSGGVVTEDDIELAKLNWQNHEHMKFLRCPVGNDYSWCVRSNRSSNDEERTSEGPVRHWMFLAPYFLYATKDSLVYAPECRLERHIRLTLEDLKRVSDVRCKVVFQAGARK